MPNKQRGNGNARGSKYGGLSHGRPGRSVSYSDADNASLQDAITAVTNAGDALTFGKTSDGGAYYVGVLADGLLERFYLDSVDALTDTLVGLIAAAETP